MNTREIVLAMCGPGCTCDGEPVPKFERCRERGKHAAIALRLIKEARQRGRQDALEIIEALAKAPDNV